MTEPQPRRTDDGVDHGTVVAPFLRGGRKPPFHGRWAVFAGFWLVYLIYPLSLTVDRQRDRPALVAVAVVGFLAFATAYLFLPPRALRVPEDDPRRYTAPVALFVIASALLPLTGQVGFTCYVFVISASIVLLPSRHASAVTLVCLGTDVALSVTVPGWSRDMWSTTYALVATALAVGGFSKLLRTARELLAAREELAQLAVTAERARFARDLHDILGHSLTVITVKAELARRLVARDPGRAETEMAEIERLGRAALQDMRATVAGYRQVSLPAELASARGVLEAAGIRADLPRAVDAVPGELHELFGWVVREGVTNVVRHSAARTCTVRAWATGIEVDDDGRPEPGGHRGGSGLTGLAERVANAGGRLVAGPRPDHGFRLRVDVPDPAGASSPACPRDAPAEVGR